MQPAAPLNGKLLTPTRPIHRPQTYRLLPHRGARDSRLTRKKVNQIVDGRPSPIDQLANDIHVARVAAVSSIMWISTQRIDTGSPNQALPR